MYKWFLLVYKVSYIVGITGYVIMMATFLGLHFFFGVKPHIWLDAGLLLMFYALYYGVMARDIAEICTEKMVSQIGVSLLAKISTYLVKIPVGNITIFSLLFFFPVL